MRIWRSIQALAAAAVLAALAGCGSSGSPADAIGSTDAAAVTDAPPVADAPPIADAAAARSLDQNRNRLLASYLAYLKAHPNQTQSNGLEGSQLSGVCDLWNRLDPSSQSVFLTLTSRMQGSTLGSDGTAMLDHVTRLYRLSGGQNATATDPGSCGGGEYNRMMMSMDAELHDALVAANVDQGTLQRNGKRDIADIPPTSFWRNSHDLGGPHTPFDLSDETNAGAPRGQVQYFRDPTSTAATSPLGRLDIETLVDPYALEMDQDYDCAHNSNPLCTYIVYGANCLPETPLDGTAIYAKNYAAIDLSWQPAGCAGGDGGQP